MSANHPPDDVKDAVRIIRRLREKKYLSREEKTEMNRAKLRVAYWACRSEGVIASRESLTYILGADGREIMNHYERYLEREKDQKKKSGEPGRPPRRSGGGTSFWDGA